MVVTGAAKRYAQAAFDLAKDQGKLDQWEHDLQSLVDVVQNPEMTVFFENPAVPAEAKQHVIEEVLPRPDQQYSRNFALLLLERDRLSEIPGVLEFYHELMLEDRGIAIAEVTTAIELTPDEQRAIEERLSQILGKTILMRPRVDPSIIGGIVARVGDDLLDGSVATQLTQLKRQMIGV
jgi:F-type H+-transporting ATPase subunit delta